MKKQVENNNESDLSDKIIQEWKEKDPQYYRLVIFHEQTFKTTPGKLFPLLCPTIEFDWMDG